MWSIATLQLSPMPRFFTNEQLGPKQSLTPEGFLVCHDVAIARTGTQLYSVDELPDLEGVGGRITIHRHDDDVFHSDTLASFEGKPVTIDHPDEEVGPGNWKTLAVGVVQNVRRGEGADNDLLFADLLITDQAGIDAVRGGLREVSCGYDAEYEQLSPGVGAQRSILGNHVALVERGRAGPRCSIQDSENPTMTTATAKPKFLDRLAAALGFKDADELEKKFNDEEELTAEEKAAKETKDTLARLTKTVDSLAAVVAKLTRDADGDEPEAKTEDSDEDEDEGEATADTVIEAETAGKVDVGQTFTGDRYTDAVARAEILVPGFKAPTHDSAPTADKFFRQVLRAVMKTADGAALVAPMLGGRDLKSFTGDALATVFVGASEIAKAKNNAGAINHAIKFTSDNGQKSPAQLVALMQANADKQYGR